MYKTEVADKIESAIAYLLMGTHDAAGFISEKTTIDGVSKKKSGRTGTYLTVDFSNLFAVDDVSPTSPYVVGVAPDSDDRLFSPHYEDLVVNPIETLGDEAETAFVLGDDGYVLWTCFRRTKAPKRAAVLGKAAAWYELHFRSISENGTGSYKKRVIPLGADGRVLPYRLGEYAVSDPKTASTVALSCSLIEDCRRAKAFTASVRDGVELRFPVGDAAYKEVFALREAPLAPTGRRKAILHWVSKHVRHTKNTSTVVDRHTRGVAEIVVDGLTVRLTPNT